MMQYQPGNPTASVHSLPSPTLLRTYHLQIINLPNRRPLTLRRMIMVMKRAAPVNLQHLIDPRHLSRIEQILRKRRGDLPALHHQLPEIGREALVGIRDEGLHGGDDGEGVLHQMASSVFEDEEDVPGRDARFGGTVVGADVVRGEVAEVFDEEFLGEGEEAEVGLEFVVVARRLDVAAVQPVDEELEGGVVVFGEVELFGFAFDEVALEGRFEVVGAVAE